MHYSEENCGVVESGRGVVDRSQFEQSIELDSEKGEESPKTGVIGKFA